MSTATTTTARLVTVDADELEVLLAGFTDTVDDVHPNEMFAIVELRKALKAPTPAPGHLLTIGEHRTSLTSEARIVLAQVVGKFLTEHPVLDEDYWFSPDSFRDEVEQNLYDMCVRYAGVTPPTDRESRWQWGECDRYAIEVVEHFTTSDPLAVLVAERYRSGWSGSLYEQWRAGR